MKKNKTIIAFFVPAVIINIVVFAILYFGVFHINMQSPDNHLAVFHLFGIFYKDLFYTCLISMVISLVFASVISCKKVKMNYIALSVLLSIIGGWAGAYAGGIIISSAAAGPVLIIALQIVILFIITIPFFIIKRGEKAETYEVQACCL